MKNKASMEDLRISPTSICLAVDITTSQRSGSQNLTLINNVSESSAGRADIVVLEMLSIVKIRDARRIAELENR